VFDSGLGGLSVLRALHQALPQAELLYVADSAHAPYGEKGEPYVVARSLALAGFLLSQGCAMLVVACNTATAAAVQALRDHHPGLPIVGIEPGVKPAVAKSAKGKVGVLATEGTLNSRKFQALVAQHRQGADIVLQACGGLAAAIEQGSLTAPAVRELVERYCGALKAAEVDTVVLGCTHYPLVAPLIAQAMGPGVEIVDTSDAVARQAARLARELEAAAGLPHGAGRPAADAVKLWSTGSPDKLQQLAQAWLGIDAKAQPLPGI
jgi:glutamate racemase